MRIWPYSQAGRVNVRFGCELLAAKIKAPSPLRGNVSRSARKNKARRFRLAFRVFGEEFIALGNVCCGKRNSKWPDVIGIAAKFSHSA